MSCPSSTRWPTSTARSATAPRRCCAGSCCPAASGWRPARASSPTTTRRSTDDARRHLPGPRRGRGRAGRRAGAACARRRDRARRGERHLRLGPAHLPRARAGRAGLHDRPRVRRDGARGRREVERVAVGDRVLGTFHTACATCTPCIRGDYHRCAHGRTFGHGSKLGDLQGAQAERLLVPRANLDAAARAGWHARRRRAVRRRRDGDRLPRRRARGRGGGRHGRGAGTGPGRAVRGAGGARVGRRAGLRDRHGRRPARDGRALRRDAAASDRRRSRGSGRAATGGPAST